MGRFWTKFSSSRGSAPHPAGASAPDPPSDEHPRHLPGGGHYPGHWRGLRGPTTVYKFPTVAARADRLSRAWVAARADPQRVTAKFSAAGPRHWTPLHGRRREVSFDALCSRRPAATRLGRPRESRSPAGLLPTRGRRTARQDPTRVSPSGTPRRPGPPPPTTTTTGPVLPHLRLRLRSAVAQEGRRRPPCRDTKPARGRTTHRSPLGDLVTW